MSKLFIFTVASETTTSGCSCRLLIVCMIAITAECLKTVHHHYNMQHWCPKLSEVTILALPVADYCYNVSKRSPKVISSGVGV